MLSIIILSIVVLPWIALIYPVLMLLVGILFKLTIAATKEVSRVESVSKSPLLSFLQESISGASTIRAFGRTQDFINVNFKLLNKNILANQWAEAVPLWFSIRVDLLAILTLATISTICVMARFQSDSIMLSLLLTYVLNFQSCLILVVRMAMDVEARMVNVQRLLSVLKVPQEKIEGDLPLE